MFDAVGRTRELTVIDEFLGALEGAPVALLLEGEPGIGKTTLWRYGVARGERSYWVLSASPAQLERELPFAALADLLEGTLERILPSLPGPQARALEVALLRAEPDGPPPGQRAIGAGLLGGLRALARAGPVLVAVDDLQWLDEASAAALAFAVRRLRDEPVGLLLTRRLEGESPAMAPLALDRAATGPRVRHLEVGPLSLGAVHRLLRARLGASFPRPTLVKLYEAAGGNPFAALEIGRALLRRGGDVEPGEPLPVPAEVTELVAERLAALPPALERALQAASLVSDPTVDLVAAAAGTELSELEPAVDAHVIELQGPRIRFTHPLLASGLTNRIDPARRRELHRRLAEAAPTLEERARHLALSSERPSEKVARVLEEAASHAAARGAAVVAAELFELAAERSPGDPARRRLEAARHHVLAGNLKRARVILRSLVERLAGTDRAEALVLLADVEPDIEIGRGLCETALLEAEGDLPRLAKAHRQLAEILMIGGDLSGARVHAATAARLAESCGDENLLIQCLGIVSHFDTYTGEITEGLLERAVALEEAASHAPAHYSPAQIMALRLMYADRLDEARGRLERALARAHDAGDEFECRSILIHLTQLEVRAGNWTRADAYAAEVEELLEQLGSDREAGDFARALVAAHLGRVEEARTALEGAALPEAGQHRLFTLLLEWVRGFLALSVGNAAEAAQVLAPVADELLAIGYRNPGVRPVLPDAIEALIAAGSVEHAGRLLAELENGGRALDNPWALAAAARCFGLLLAREDDVSGALAAFERALAEHERAASPFERARTLLAYGATLRRAKRRRDAREALALALDAFERLGAALFVERTREEVARIGGRAPSSGRLTPTERRLAALVAEGRSNKEAAAALYVTAKTVETTLSRMYAKLGIHSRTELVRLFLDEEQRDKL